MEKKLPFSVCIAMVNSEGKILGVTRKHDWNDFGMPGGKIEPTDDSAESAIRREVMEETGLTIENLKFQFIKQHMHNGQLKDVAVFTGEAKGEFNYTEPHLVEWVDPTVLILGSFGTFNRDAFTKLGILY